MLRTWILVVLCVDAALSFPQSIPERVSSDKSSSSSPPVSYNKEVQVTSSNGNPYKQGLFDAIFQIPIATLRAVNNLVNEATSRGTSYTKSIRVN